MFLKVDGDQAWQKVAAVLDEIRLASDRARQETAGKNHCVSRIPAGDTEKPGWSGRDGGDIKVAITLKHREP